MRNCLNLWSQDKGCGKAQASCSSDSPKKNHFYAILYRGKQETSPDMVTGKLKMITLDVYALVYPGTTLSFVTPLEAKKFDALPNILHEPFLVSTPVGESVVPKRIYQNCPISLPNSVSYVDLVELDMLYFYTILGMDLLHACFASISCSTRVVRFNCPNELVVE